MTHPIRTICTAFGVLLGIYILWPYLALFNLYVALTTGDAPGVEQRIDWKPFNEGLRKDLDRRMEREINRNLKKEGIRISFDSLTLSKDLSAKIGTPEGLIYLFNQPEEFIKQIRRVFQNAVPPDQVKPPAPQKKPYAPEGPNIPSLFERIDYVFFTGMSSFRLSFKKGDLHFILDWRRRGAAWKLIHLSLPLDKM